MFKNFDGLSDYFYLDICAMDQNKLFDILHIIDIFQCSSIFYTFLNALGGAIFILSINLK